ncbi:dual specificity mitogen-activated protein kinase kinase 5-like [Mytilus californianus]|uniref:dual specificity mitogen-activated protein kinase kinase 5-like n=1 Tax=Mytilus californianus TaxID=6549 RepID=UPI00224833DF|nr:dual specificity mitogen-activated protein kinase kinase 5-like [Mytilus californianus]
MALQPTFTVRIRTEQEQDMDWMVQPDQITFNQALEVISRVLPQATITAFEYEDEDGDRITVRSDEEMRSMFQTYFNLLSDEDYARGLLPPLIIYPRVGKTPQNRNKFGLKIKTDKQSISKSSKPVLMISDIQKNNNPKKNCQSMDCGDSDTGRPPGQPLHPASVTHFDTVQPTGQFSQPAEVGHQPFNMRQNLHPTEMGHNPTNTGQALYPAGIGQGLHPAEVRPQPTNPTGMEHKLIRTSSDLRQLLATQVISEEDLQILNLIGKGNVGCVYRALHKPTQAIMAVKVMLLDVSTEEQSSILSELDILNKCNSPVIIGFYKAFFVENRISICTEFMDGGSLDKYGLIPEHILGRMAVSMVEGLCYMWALKILHRDIKPSNVLVNTQGQVKLCDFGVSTQLVKSIAKTYIGTNAYMAPERIRGEVYSHPAEVWSFGITLFELVQGRFPYDNMSVYNSPMALLNRITSEPTPRLSENEYSPDFIDFVSRCMQPIPSHRLKMEELSVHSFIQRNNDGNLAIIAAWIQAKLAQRQSIS